MKCKYKWNLKVNESKTEITTVDRNLEDWKNVRKLGNLINESEDVKNRKILAQNAFRTLKNIWKQDVIDDFRKIQLYEALVLPILLYNCGTWGLTKVNLEMIDSLHRKHLRIILGIFWPQTISNKELYEKCRRQPLSNTITRQRWKLFGHILRRESTIPAQTAMADYFKENGTKYLGRTPTSLATTINKDIKNYKLHINTTPHNLSTEQLKKIPQQLQSTKDLLKLTELAQDRKTWQKITQQIEQSHNKQSNKQ